MTDIIWHPNTMALILKRWGAVHTQLQAKWTQHRDHYKSRWDNFSYDQRLQLLQVAHPKLMPIQFGVDRGVTFENSMKEPYPSIPELYIPNLVLTTAESRSNADKRKLPAGPNIIGLFDYICKINPTFERYLHDTMFMVHTMICSELGRDEPYPFEADVVFEWQLLLTETPAKAVHNLTDNDPAKMQAAWDKLGAGLYCTKKQFMRLLFRVDNLYQLFTALMDEYRESELATSTNRKNLLYKTMIGCNYCRTLDKPLK
ncbi:hypothetical protein HDV05_000430, partial [Chytridiales sp. JEL 0842]